MGKAFRCNECNVFFDGEPVHRVTVQKSGRYYDITVTHRNLVPDTCEECFYDVLDSAVKYYRKSLDKKS